MYAIRSYYETLGDNVEPTAVIPHHAAERDPDQKTEKHGHKCKANSDPEPVDQPCQNITAGDIGA